MTKDEALRLALEALQSGDYWKGVEAVNAIKQALEKPEPEPVACKHRIADVTNEVVKSGYMCMDCGALFGAYTSPPKREPLTDEQKVALCKQFPDHLTFNAIHAVEAAHGIKGEA